MDTVLLRELRFDTIVGILPSERVTPQPMVLDVDLGMDLEPIGETGDLGLGVDYAAVEAQLTAMAQEGEFWLIETLALAAVRWLRLDPFEEEGRGRIHQAAVTIRKPTILGGRAVPGVRVSREGPVPAPVEEAGGVWVERVVATDKDGVWRVRLQAGARWEPGPDQGLMVVAGTVIAGSERREPGARPGRGCGPVEAVDGPAVLLVAGTPVTERALGA